MIRLVLADDEDLVRAALRMILDSPADITVVAEAADGQAAVEAARKYRPDVVVMDIQMPRLDGLTAAHQLADLPQPPAVLLLTTFDLDTHVRAAVKAGAAGYLLKNSHHEELLTAVRAVHQGDAVFSPPVARRVLKLAGSAVTDDASAARLQELTEKERKVLALVGSGLSNAAIASRLGLSEPAVKRQVRQLLAKLDCENRVQLAITALNAGITPPGI